jgi:integrase
MQAEYDIIKRARELLATLPKSMQRLFKAGQSHQTLLTVAMNTTKVATWFSRKAAIKHASRDLVERLLHQQDQAQRVLRSIPADDPRWTEWRKTVRSLGQWSTLLQTVHDAPAIPKEGRKNRHSKRQDMKGLPDDWRERIIARMPNYASAALVAAVTGCRPEELLSGVHITVEDGFLVAHIIGAKNTEKTGQPWRRLFWRLDSESVLVKALIKIVGERQVNDGLKVQIKSTKAFSGAMAAASKREWPGRKSSLTAYCFRHQAAADMKSAGRLSDSDISAALGHISDVTKSTYGHPGMGRSGGVAPDRVKAARPVRKVAVNFKKYSNKLKNIAI